MKQTTSTSMPIKGLIDVRSSLGPDDDQCGLVSGILDLSDKKCEDFGRDHVCCKKPDFRVKKCKVNIYFQFHIKDIHNLFHRTLTETQ